MNQDLADDTRLKTLLKEAIVEVLEERGDLLREAFEGALEDVGLANAIKEGEQTPAVNRETVFSILEGSR